MIAYLSLILDELVPKHTALQRSSEVSLLTAPTLDRFTTVMRPVIWLLSASTDRLVRLLGGGPESDTRSDRNRPAVPSERDGLGKTL
ncbi:CNNM domain-containing protein [Rhodococcus sp. DK17]|jgi:putative hemolysin|uniref:CNNM domain-containing protein n=1 Tax=unclassified Rhodococcus (in: high G+C Gram-positive bacteria) TaxID=192944 RepID=UPI00037F0FCE